ncbi:MAG: ORF6N domain-containing protein, partial [Opitutaceae bacterium]
MLREQRVLLDRDLASLYGVTTKRLNEQVRRNSGRFPPDFRFQIDHEEVANLRSQFATSSQGHGGKRHLPFAFTEHGALMAAQVLHSPEAVAMSVHVVRAFVRLRRMLVDHHTLAAKR